MPYAKVVARYRDGRLLKGSTSDFQPNKDRFHLALSDAGPGARPVEVRLSELKAVFFVRDFKGDPGRHDRQLFDPRKPLDPSGIRVGTPALTTRGMGVDEMRRIGKWMLAALKGPDDLAQLARIRDEVIGLCRHFPTPAQRDHGIQEPGIRNRGAERHA